MSIPYLPGIGDTFQHVLPDLGKNLQSIFAPHITAQKDIYKKLLEDPEKINQYIDVARTNPGALGLKEQDVKALASRDYTPKYKRQIEREELDTALGKEQLEGAKTSNRITKEKQQYIDSIQDPDFKKFVVMNSYGLKTPEEYKATKIDQLSKEISLKLLQDGVADMKSLKQMGKIDVKKLVRGELSNEELRLIYSNEGLSKWAGQMMAAERNLQDNLALLARQEAISIRGEVRANDRAAIEHGKERARLLNQSRMLTIDIRKKKAGKNDSRIDELNRINQVLFQEHGLPFTRYEWDEKGIGGRWVKSQLGPEGATFSELGGSLPLEFDLDKEINDWKLLTPEEQKSYTQIEPDRVALIQDALRTSPGTDAARKPSATISGIIKGKVNESAGGRLISAALRRAVDLLMKTIPSLSEADAIKKAMEAGFK